ncbi:hypothetical protein SAMN04489707_1005126 [Paenacidovorax caeni]|uniref:Uncharacterized protein n=1 Tax=Paenacidovorax caeni TaxID=343013 RepID=A0A1I7GI95_9BURK|nr:hypothetical protein [Paenacidovorax caeni]SFU48041.1 hypothetical protein SAMN04489707_1005126 [Paenacidovorax caeni]
MNPSSESICQGNASEQAYTPAQQHRFAELWDSRKIVFTVEGALRDDSPDVPPSLLVQQAFTELFAANPHARSHLFPFAASNGVRISFQVSPNDEELRAEMAKVV